MGRCFTSALHSGFLLSVVAGCSPSDRTTEAPSAKTVKPPATASSPANDEYLASARVIEEGRIEAGETCPILHTPAGARFALIIEGRNYEMGEYVRVSGSLDRDRSCEPGLASITVERIKQVAPPARDRDPARAGGIAITSEYVRGSWVAKGLDADCREPDFVIRPNANGLGIIRAELNGEQRTGAVDVGATPELHFDEPIPALPIETRGPDGLAVLPPPTGERVVIAGHGIEGDGEVFVRCAD